MNQPGIFTISLDFELYWGVLPRLQLDQYAGQLKGSQDAIRQILDLHKEFDIHATWATVGFLMAKDKKELLAFPESHRPTYHHSKYNPYPFIQSFSEKDSYALFAQDLIHEIQSKAHQAIGSHTYSHYFCLEAGQEVNQFRKDIQQAVVMAQKLNISLKTMVFPRNQYDKAYIDICVDQGIPIFRGNPDHYLYQPRSRDEESLVLRSLRLLDSYVNLSGHQCHRPTSVGRGINVPASRFLRPYSPKLKFLDRLKLNRIRNEMTYAAKKGLLYHLWWHPHNFGKYTAENIAFLSRIYQHYQFLQAEYGFTSLNMEEVGAQYPVS